MISEDHSALARTKTEEATGGDVNYYLVVIPEQISTPECIVEIEDIIEALDMRFADANVFKAVVRMTKLRKDLGKPGSTAEYEAGKAVYYADRVVAQAERRQNGTEWTGIFGMDASLAITQPKRLAPYEFRFDDFIEALDPSHSEAAVLDAIFTVCRLRLDMNAPAGELHYANKAAAAARQIVAEISG